MTTEVAIAPEVTAEDIDRLQLHTDAEKPWAVVLKEKNIRMNPGLPAFATQAAAESYMDDLKKSGSGWVNEETTEVDMEWRPDLDLNPNATKARDLVEEVEDFGGELAHDEAVQKLLMAQVYATLAVRDQIAGFSSDAAAAGSD